MNVYARAKRLRQRRDGREVQPRAARADDDRRDQDMQPVDAARLDESGQRARAALDQYAAQSPREQRLHNVARREASVPRGEFYPLDARAGFGRRGADQNPPRAVLGQPFAGLVQPAAGVDRDAGGARPDDPPHVELGVVGGDGSGADHDSVDMGAQTMQMIERRRAADAAQLAADGGDPSIERLADLRHDEGAVLRGRAQRGEGIAGLVEPRGKIKVGRGARHLGSLFLDRPGLC